MAPEVHQRPGGPGPAAPDAGRAPAAGGTGPGEGRSVPAASFPNEAEGHGATSGPGPAGTPAGPAGGPAGGVPPGRDGGPASQGVEPPAGGDESAGPRAGEEGWLERVAALTGVRPQEPGLFLEALTHASYRAEHPDTAERDNERLEFLGDAVLNLCVTDYIFRTYPERPEGELSKLRAATVRAETLAATAERLGLGALLRLGRGEEATGGRHRPSVLADAFEAVVAAVYLQSGLEGARDFILRALGDEIRRLGESDRACDDPKTALQELSRRLGLGEPSYRVVGASGPEHDPRYTVEVRVGGRALGRAVGRSKKIAEREAARAALATLGEEPGGGEAPNRPAGGRAGEPAGGAT